MYCTLLLLFAAPDMTCCPPDSTETMPAVNAGMPPGEVLALDDADADTDDTGGNEMGNRQVMVEIRVPKSISREDAFTFINREIVIEGFELDSEYGAVPMEPTDGMVRNIDEAAEQIFLVRGVLDDGTLQALKAIDRVVSVFDEGRIEHFDVD